MKAIESGAICLIVSSVVPENNGKYVTALRFIGKLKGADYDYKGGDWWLIDSLIINTHGDRIPYIRACRLIPIGRASNCCRDNRRGKGRVDILRGKGGERFGYYFKGEEQ